MDKLLGEFIDETGENLAILGERVAHLKRHPDDAAALATVFRLVHNIKGACGFLRLPRTQAVSHVAEDRLMRMRAGDLAPTPEVWRAIDLCLERLVRLVADLARDGKEPPGDDGDLLGAMKPGPNGSTGRAASPAPTAVPQGNEVRAPARCAAAPGAPEKLVGEIRLRPAGVAWKALPPLVDQLSLELGKSVELRLWGEATWIEAGALLRLKDPLIHLTRNALDHGLEAPRERARAGKPARGRLSVGARYARSGVVVEVADDGRGLDLAAIAAKALAIGHVTQGALARLDERALARLIFAPGMSTAREVSMVSGRGVGLDVARDWIAAAGGSIDVEWRAGEGTRMVIALPQEVMPMPVVPLSAAGRLLAVPAEAVVEVVHVTPDGDPRVELVCDMPILKSGPHLVPVVGLAGLLDPGGTLPAHRPGPLVVLAAGAARFALAVDSVAEGFEAAVRPLASPAGAGDDFAGEFVDQAGRAGLLLDPPGLAAAAGIPLGDERTARAPVPASGRAARGVA